MKIPSTTKEPTVKFNPSNNFYNSIKFRRTDRTIIPKMEVTPVEQDIYYDEIIYYDGGDVHGYGDS